MSTMYATYGRGLRDGSRLLVQKTREGCQLELVRDAYVDGERIPSVLRNRFPGLGNFLPTATALALYSKTQSTEAFFTIEQRI